jgi:hypothetical protein
MQLGFAESLLGQVFGVRSAAGQPIRVAIQDDVTLVDQPLNSVLTAGQSHGGNLSLATIHDRGGLFPAFQRTQQCRRAMQA